MEAIKKTEDFLLMEKCFKELKEKTSITQNLDIISRVISRSFDLQITLSIVDNKTNQFFGMNIFPETSTMDTMITNILNEKTKVDIVIDLLDKGANPNICNFKGDSLISMYSLGELQWTQQ